MSNSDFELPINSRNKKPQGPASAPFVAPNKTPSTPSPTLATKSISGALNESGDDDETKEPTSNKNGEPFYPQEELFRVFDEIIFSGEYRESFNIRGKVPVTFRTRTAEEISEIQRFIDSSDFKLISTVESVRSVMNLRYALCNYRDKNLELMKDTDRAVFIESLPGPIIGMLLNQLSKFDSKVSQACREGEENF